MLNTIYNKIYLRLFGSKKYAEKLGVCIGERGRFYISDWGSEPYLIKIGDDVTITSGVRLLTHDGSTELVTNEDGERFYNYGRIKIEDNVFIGVNSIIMLGVTIGSNTIVGAGSIVTRDLEGGYVYAGSPAKKISSIVDYRKKVSLKGKTWKSLKGVDKKQKVLSFFTSDNCD